MAGYCFPPIEDKETPYSNDLKPRNANDERGEPDMPSTGSRAGNTAKLFYHLEQSADAQWHIPLAPRICPSPASAS